MSDETKPPALPGEEIDAIAEDAAFVLAVGAEELGEEGPCGCDACNLARHCERLCAAFLAERARAERAEAKLAAVAKLAAGWEHGDECPHRYCEDCEDCEAPGEQCDCAVGKLGAALTGAP